LAKATAILIMSIKDFVAHQHIRGSALHLVLRATGFLELSPTTGKIKTAAEILFAKYY
jgi:hypothetical protein